MFFDQLVKACKMRNITVTGLTTNLAISKSNVTNWKNGTIPNGEVIIRISDFLGVSTDFLLKGMEDNISKSIIGTNNQNPTIIDSQNFEVNGIKNEHMLNASFYTNRLSFEHIEIKNENELSENTKELIRVFENLPVREQIHLMSIVYAFEEEYKKTIT
ncbi:MAG: helix-turn-helix domain-containing protein [Ruminococcus sp.]|nr:helix-turn-helix domain-containing protein [Ruminococcus sp.]MDE6679085.1 helix-turn-helix domain-containing protein [Ruminococcus sp.]